MAQLTQGITPEKIALTLAVGSACALFPVPGTATLLCLVVGITLRLNQPLIQLVNALCAIPHLIVFYCLIRFGDFLFGLPQPRWTISEFILHPRARFNLWALLHSLWSSHDMYLHMFGAAILHALVAWAIIAPLWVLAVYRCCQPPLVRAARRHGRLVVIRSGSEEPRGDSGADI